MVRRLGGQMFAGSICFVFALCLNIESSVWAQKPSPDCPGPGKAVVFQSVVRAAVGEIKEPGQLVIRDATQWKAQWKRLGIPLKPPPAVPNVDFSTSMIVAVFAGQGRGVLEIEVKGAERRAGCLLINVTERHLPDSLPATQFGNFRPFHVVKLPKTADRVVFKQTKTKG